MEISPVSSTEGLSRSAFLVGLGIPNSQLLVPTLLERLPYTKISGIYTPERISNIGEIVFREQMQELSERLHGVDHGILMKTFGDYGPESLLITALMARRVPSLTFVEAHEEFDRSSRLFRYSLARITEEVFS